MDYQEFPVTTIPAEIKEKLSKITYVISDADGTMFTGAKATVDSHGKPSYALIEVLCELKRAGIKVIPCTGRNRSMIFEDARILNLDGWIAEMGGILCLDNSSSPEWYYFTGDMPFDEQKFATPHSMIEQSGVIEEILKRYKGKVETYHDNGIGFEYREVSVALRGTLPEDEIQQMLDATGLALYMSNNGFVRRVTGPTTLTCDREHPEDVHTYHIMPKGLTKGTGIKKFIELKGLKPEEVLGAGDSPADLEIADACDLFLFMKNGLDHPDVLGNIKKHDNVLVSQLPSTDGWVQAMKILLACKE